MGQDDENQVDASGIAETISDIGDGALLGALGVGGLQLSDTLEGRQKDVGTALSVGAIGLGASSVLSSVEEGDQPENPGGENPSEVGGGIPRVERNVTVDGIKAGVIGPFSASTDLISGKTLNILDVPIFGSDTVNIRYKYSIDNNLNEAVNFDVTLLGEQPQGDGSFLVSIENVRASPGGGTENPQENQLRFDIEIPKVLLGTPWTYTLRLFDPATGNEVVTDVVSNFNIE